MIDPARFVDHCTNVGIELFAGVPDSLLKSFNAQLMHTLPREQHVITANEGAAVGLALGHHLRTGRPGLVYLQNSGFGNVINPLLSLADPDVYGIPMVLVVGWRGQPGVTDEPQHVKQGRIQEQLIDALELPWAVLPGDDRDAEACLRRAVDVALERSCPYVLLVPKGTFAEPPDGAAAAGYGPSAEETATREEALEALIDALGPGTVNISTTGMLSRELFELRAAADDVGSLDFLTVGGMGHASSIAFGVAMGEPEREVWCLDGDGALLMHLGVLPVIADHAPANLFHVVFNNGVHDSVGGQPTSISQVRVAEAARALGYGWAASTSDPGELPELVTRMRHAGGPCLLEIRVRPGSRPGLGRPTRTPRESKAAFMKAISTERT